MVFLGVADKKTVISVAYRDPKTHYAFAKRFIVDKFILDKTYHYLEEGMILEFISDRSSQIFRIAINP